LSNWYGSSEFPEDNFEVEDEREVQKYFMIYKTENISLHFATYTTRAKIRRAIH
jgi:hypothetical protein